MSHYYFNMRSADDYVRDPEGIELANMDEVRKEAIESARDLLSDAIRANRNVDHQEFEVLDEAGEVVLVYPLRDAIKLP